MNPTIQPPLPLHDHLILCLTCFQGSTSNADENEGAAGGDEVVEGEDTMKNLRKTFAGIFGDM